MAADGSITTGILRYDDPEKIIVRSRLTGDEVTLPKSRVLAVQPVASLMPAGIVDQMTRQQFLDLTAFLTALGRVGEFTPSNEPVVRRWRVRALESRPNDSDLDALLAADASNDGWLPAYATVAGKIPAPELAALSRYALARGDLEVSQAGKIRLQANRRGVLATRIGNRATRGAVIDVPAGRVSIVFVIDTRARGGVPLQAALMPAPTGGARFQIVGGR